ncbi:MAG: peptidase C2 calpain [Leptolyngbyaceae cyanobacterium SU_3_3]|nr:peptidase C2 calpain [Leptolyngbyaceae cyanobacterium SU_3_3]
MSAPSLSEATIYEAPSTLNLGVLSGTSTFSDFVGRGNPLDIYQFSVTSSDNSRIALSITLSDLSHDADIQLIQDSNSNEIVDESDLIASSNQIGSAAEMIQQSAIAGTYFVRVSGNTSYHLSISTGDWFGTHLSDAGLIGKARHLSLDGVFDRSDMIALLNETKDQSTIDAAELRDLKTIVRNADRFAMPDSVRVLAHKVVNSDPANLRSGIGSLYTDSSDEQMERLIGKWFLGNDRPIALSFDRSTQLAYQLVNGSLVQKGISYQDIVQQDVSNCYFLAALGAVALRSPDTIASMFSDNGDNTYTVRFFNNGVADYVTVDRFLPTHSTGYAAFADWGGGRFDQLNNELWVALLEKAYAQLNESGWIGQDNTNSYNGTTLAATSIAGNQGGINHGWTKHALAQIIGRNVDTNYVESDASSINALISLDNADKIVSMNTHKIVNPYIVANHSYILINYSEVSQKFRLYNPWGYETELTRQQVSDNFSSWDFTVA